MVKTRSEGPREWLRAVMRGGLPWRRLVRGVPVMMPALLIALLLPVAGLRAQTKTTVADTIHGPDGSLPDGQIVISANSTFTAADGSVVFRGTVATVTVTNGGFSAALIPNAGSTPSGTSYSAIYKLAGVPYRDETWVVPASATPVNLSAVRSAALGSPSQLVLSSQMPALTGDVTTNAGSTVTTIQPYVVSDKGGQVFNVKAYGAIGDGATDDTAAVQAALSAASGASGGTLYFPSGTYNIGCLTIPTVTGTTNIGGTIINDTPSIRLTGAGSDMAAVGNAHRGKYGAIFNFTACANVAHIVTLGQGHLEIDHLLFNDALTDAVPMIWDTNTVMHVHDNAFYGGVYATSASQDVVVLGGGGSVVNNNTSGAFQGYGTSIDHNFFDIIRRAVWGQGASVNSVWIKDNTVWKSAGTNLAGGGAIEIDNGIGNHVQDNLIEVVNYPYGIVDSSGTNEHILRNDIWDQIGHTLDGVHVVSSRGGIEVVCGSMQLGLPCQTGATNKDRVVDPVVGQVLQPDGSSSVPAYSFAAHPTYGFFFDPSLGMAYGVGVNEYAAFTTKGLWMRSDGGMAWSSDALPVHADTELWRLGAQTLGVGSMTTGSSTGTMVATKFQVGSVTGPAWTSGSGVPSGACTAGSLYTSTAGGAGSTLYVCEAGSWAAK